MPSSHTSNHIGRVLVVDDNPAIHEDFRKIFSAGDHVSTALADAEAALFGDSAAVNNLSHTPRFNIDSALQGLEAVELAKRARQANAPYAVAFIDVRMPPGLDGLETTVKIWEADADVQVVICTAYSDYSWSEMLAKLGHSDRLVILKKPFDNIEVLQLANALTEKWRLTHRARTTSQHAGTPPHDCSTELAMIGTQANRLVEATASLVTNATTQQRVQAQTVLTQMQVLVELITQLQRQVAAGTPSADDIR